MPVSLDVQEQIKKLESRYNALRYSYNKRKVKGWPRCDKLHREMQEIQSKIIELKENG
ncbi:hypothetical protein [Virgibacillus sp. YIM 98842]|uniref:hypothetical protein n=1 Tax=Virgibacillus sp. YIM 98842 TaxID=2663533 RepID=UPI0013D8E6B8|nr:hypothetical protein [Virgibacillus sp. YIM 98842]